MSKIHKHFVSIKLDIAIILIALSLIPILMHPFRALSNQPYPDSQEYIDSAYQLFYGNGYITYVHEKDTSLEDFKIGAQPPRYPPGTSIALIPFILLVPSYPLNIEIGIKFYTCLIVLLSSFIAWKIGKFLPAIITAFIISSSTFVYAMSRNVLSESIMGVLTLLILLSLISKKSFLSGLFIGISVLVRQTGLITILIFLLTNFNLSKKKIVFGLIPSLIILLFQQYISFGHPLKTGYGYWLPNLTFFSAEYIIKNTTNEGPWIIPDLLESNLLNSICNPCGIGGALQHLPNIVFYPSVILGLFWIFAPPGFTLIGLIWCFKHFNKPGERFTLLFLSSHFFYLFFFYQSSRFISSPMILLTIYSSVALTNWLKLFFKKTKYKQIN